MALPAITQKPDCDLPIEGLKIGSIGAEVAKNKVLSVLSIDFPNMSIYINTDDVATFSGKLVDLEVVPQQDLVDQARSLLIKIDFEIDVSDT